MSFLIAIYVGTAVLLAVYGINSWILTILYLKNRRNSPAPPTSKIKYDLPSVTVQLPIFNEALVVERLIDAVVKLEYPIHRLQFQVLDDSTDETTDIALSCIEAYRDQGLNIELIRRRDRVGFKAGALKHGLEKATGQLVAIFDADFVPQPDFLRQTIPYFIENPGLGFVQARWGHVNCQYSPLTIAQSIAIDGHFVVEQTARNRTGLLMNFNGTAGVWRRDCIETVGGWQMDTLCEDFDLSYRAQLAGWECLFLPEVVAPAEIPPQLAAFKRQQFRWAKGSIQCLKKLSLRVLFSSLSWPVKVQAFIHLSNYLAHFLLVVLAIITPIMVLNNGSAHIRFPLIYLSLASLGPPVLYAVSQAALYPSTWKNRYKMMPMLILLGTGIALSSTRAVIEAILGVGNIFRRTPKFNILSMNDHWQNSNYSLPLDGIVLGELAISLYSFWGAWAAATTGNQFAVPFILLYAFSFGYVGLQGLWDARVEIYNWFARGNRRQVPQVRVRQKASRLN